ncbi:hypothetical protein [Streptomyces sp. H27-H5]|uniref:hypothetical protein n=1 Tax=Streptomyces sp. H27-H5 TaxID=2996460 RepID=UPI002270BED8|nr:hypothetical protein [Streptomyces sp. H27-H5]MCY0957655.1 hypothetical protein [Streptomyces sp. H27-H5]
MKSRSIYRSKPDHVAAAAEARAQRGVWVPAALYPARESAAGAAKRVRRAEGLRAYGPAGAFEAYVASHADGWALWVRWVAGDEPVPALPDAMTVRVTSRGDGPGYSGVGIITVTVAARCPQCGGPRGWDTVAPIRFPEDGEWYTADKWTNPCGHMDLYASVLREARTRPVPQPVAERPPAALPIAAPPAPGSPAGIVLAAAEERRGMHAAQAARLLHDLGMPEAAEVIRTEMAARKGHMSAKAAAHYLHAGGAR